MPRAKGRVFIEIPETLRDKMRELSAKHNLTYEELLSKALQLFTQGNTLGISQQEQPKTRVEVIRRDYFWWTIRAGEGWNAVETYLNNIQLGKLCQAKLLAQEVCEKVDLWRIIS
jgi:hypothetical protein